MEGTGGVTSVGTGWMLRVKNGHCWRYVKMNQVRGYRRKRSRRSNQGLGPFRKPHNTDNKQESSMNYVS